METRRLGWKQAEPAEQQAGAPFSHSPLTVYTGRDLAVVRFFRASCTRCVVFPVSRAGVCSSGLGGSGSGSGSGSGAGGRTKSRFCSFRCGSTESAAMACDTFRSSSTSLFARDDVRPRIYVDRAVRRAYAARGEKAMKSCLILLCSIFGVFFFQDPSGAG